MTTHIDVAIIGASFAGLSAALMLARARKTIVLIDDDSPRNRFAAASHGVLGQDGVAPAAIRARGLAEVLAYPTARHIRGRVTAVSGAIGAFDIAGPEPLRAKRVILAYGQRDTLPDIPGLAECWGNTANQCPYCHGYELADQPTGLLVNSDFAMHRVLHLREWTANLTVLENGAEIDAASRTVLAAAGVSTVSGKVAALIHDKGKVSAVRLEDGREVALAALYLSSTQTPAAPFAADLGCAMTMGMMGPHVSVDMFQRTSVPGVFAAGDLGRPFPTAPLAASSGTMAGTGCHMDLIGLLPPPEAA